MSQLNFSQAVRRVTATFRAEKSKHANCTLVGDSVITKRLQARGIKLHVCPKDYKPGFAGTLGRINYAAAISNDDAEAVAALAQERARRTGEAK